MQMRSIVARGEEFDTKFSNPPSRNLRRRNNHRPTSSGSTANRFCSAKFLRGENDKEVRGKKRKHKEGEESKKSRKSQIKRQISNTNSKKTPKTTIKRENVLHPRLERTFKALKNSKLCVDNWTKS
jgi:hypothetical protein